jgi:4-carboxymuconolactone decarboxylase
MSQPPRSPHLESTPLFEKGLAVRREVLGAAYVDKSVAEADAFSAPLQQFVTETCWGSIWTRPGLARRERSLINLGMITALNHSAEVRLHVRGAINLGITREEIMEVLLQTAAYCGVPAALDSFKAAREVFKEIDAEAAAGKAAE